MRLNNWCKYAFFPSSTKKTKGLFRLTAINGRHIHSFLGSAVLQSIKMKIISAISVLLWASCAHSASFQRRLSYERIAGYEPKSQVTDHNAIDLDQEVSSSTSVYSCILQLV
jgi:hypothetical protein